MQRFQCSHVFLHLTIRSHYEHAIRVFKYHFETELDKKSEVFYYEFEKHLDNTYATIIDVVQKWKQARLTQRMKTSPRDFIELQGLDLFRAKYSHARSDEQAIVMREKLRFSPIGRVKYILQDGWMVPSKERYRGRTIKPQKPDTHWTSGIPDTHWTSGILGKNCYEHLPVDAQPDTDTDDELSPTQPPEPSKTGKSKERRKREMEEVTEVVEVANEEKMPTAKKKKKKAQGNIAAFGQNALNSSLPEKGEVQKRTMRPTTSATKALSKKNEMNVWEVGVLECKLKNGQEKLDRFGKDVLNAVEASVKTVNNVIRACQKAALFLVEHLMNDSKLHFLLQQLLSNGKKDDGGQQFWTCLMQLIYCGESGSKNVLIRYLKTLPELELFLVPEREKIILHGSFFNLFENNAKTLAAAFRGQIIGKMNMLVARVLEETAEQELQERTSQIEEILKLSCSRLEGEALEQYLFNIAPYSESVPSTPSDCSEPISENELDDLKKEKRKFQLQDYELSEREDVDDLNSNLDIPDALFEDFPFSEQIPATRQAQELDDAVYKFVLINQMLSNPWIIVPQSSMIDCYISITEASLLPLLDPELLEKKTGIKKSSDSLPSWLKHGKLNQPQGHLWKALFGPKLGGRFQYCTIDEHLDRIGSKEMVQLNSEDGKLQSNPF